MRPRFDAEKKIYYDDNITIKCWPELTARKNGKDFIPEITLSSSIVVPDNFSGISELGQEKILTKQHWLNWCDTIPRDVIKLASPFKKEQWLVLKCLQIAGSPAMELCSSNKGLFFALAISSRYVDAAAEDNVEFIKKHINMPRREIAGALGFPPSEQSVKILGKFKASECSDKLIDALRDIMKSEKNRNYLSHLPVINKPVLSLMYDPEYERYTTPSLFFSIANNRKKLGSTANKLPAILSDLIKIRSSFFESRKNFRFKSYEQIIEMHLALEEFWGPINNRKRNIPLPEPPFKVLSDQIVPLKYSSELFEESDEMRNCVKTYLDEILSGRAFFYKVLNPRLVFLVRKNDEGLWQLVDIRGFANCRIDENVKLEITELVDEAYNGLLDLSFLKNADIFEIFPGKEERNLRKEEIPF